MLELHVVEDHILAYSDATPSQVGLGCLWDSDHVESPMPVSLCDEVDITAWMPCKIMPVMKNDDNLGMKS
jgi:hypothetical protein